MKKPKAKAARKTPPKTRTSIWLDDSLRSQLDRKCLAEHRSLAEIIQMLLRKALGKPTKETPDAPIFG